MANSTCNEPPSFPCGWMAGAAIFRWVSKLGGRSCAMSTQCEQCLFPAELRKLSHSRIRGYSGIFQLRPTDSRHRSHRRIDFSNPRRNEEIERRETTRKHSWRPFHPSNPLDYRRDSVDNHVRFSSTRPANELGHLSASDTRIRNVPPIDLAGLPGAEFQCCNRWRRDSRPWLRTRERWTGAICI